MGTAREVLGRNWRNAAGALVLFGLGYFFFFHRLAERDLWGSHEARAAQDAGSMLETRDWRLPRLTDETVDLQKPPMFYWLVAGTAWARGTLDEWSVRLPAALAATLTVLVVATVLLQRGRPVAAFLAALTLMSAQHFTWLARTARIDMPLTLCVALAVITIGLNRRWQLAGFLAIAAGVLLKGPIGLVLPLAVIVGDWLWAWLAGPKTPPSPPRSGEGRSRAQDIKLRTVERAGTAPLVQIDRPSPLREGDGGGVFAPNAFQESSQGRGEREGKESACGEPSPIGSWAMARPFLWGLPLVAAIALPWFIAANEATNGQFFRVFFWYHNVDRALGSSGELAVHPWWYYGPRLLVDALPWSLVLIPAIVLMLRQGIWRNDREARFGLVWLLAVAAVLSCAKFKRADYLLPAYPGLAMLLGCLGERLWQLAGQALKRGLAVALACTIAATVAAWIYVIHWEHPHLEPGREQRTFARAIREIAPPPEQILFFRVECHALAFHLGRPINSFLEWENLDVWAGRPGTFYILMTPEDAQRWPRYVTAGRLEEVIRTTQFSGGVHDRPLVLMRTRPKIEPLHAAPRQQTADCQVSNQHGPAGAEPGRAGRASGSGLGDRASEARAPLRAAAGR